MYFVNSKYVLLTYAQCGDLDEWAVSDHMSSLGAECIIGREIHPRTGGVHLHVFVDFDRKFRSRRVDIFDVEGWHPNVSPSKGSPEKGYDYAIKDGDVVAGGLERPCRGGPSTLVALKACSDLFETQNEFLDVYNQVDTGGLIDNFANIRSYAKWKYASVLPKYDPPRGTRGYGPSDDGRDEWVLQSGIRHGDMVLSKLFQWAERINNRRGVPLVPTGAPPKGPTPQLVLRSRVMSALLTFARRST